VNVRATEAGRQAVEEIDGWRTDLLQRLFGELDATTLARVANAMAAMRASLGASPCGDSPWSDSSAGHAGPAEPG
jgi:hypothetical protein